jgi:predicted secreted protein
VPSYSAGGERETTDQQSMSVFAYEEVMDKMRIGMMYFRISEKQRYCTIKKLPEQVFFTQKVFV